MLKVGLTGGIGSGKTLVSDVFKHLSIPVFNADNESKKLVNSDLETINKLKKEFGDEIYSVNGINRKLFADIIFNDKEALVKANQIIHPRVKEVFCDWILQNKNAPYVIEEAAILFESKANVGVDFTINVHADELVRINRVVVRDNTSEELVRNRIKNQLSDKERIELADFTVYNNEKVMLLPQILEIHNKILKG